MSAETALRPWLRHRVSCNCKTDDPPDTERCKCGLRAALAAHRVEPEEETVMDNSEPKLGTVYVAGLYPVSLWASVIAPDPEDSGRIEVVYYAEVAGRSATAGSPEDAVLLAADKLHQDVLAKGLDLVPGISSQGSRWIEAARDA